MPRLKSKAELQGEVSYKKAWNAVGAKSDCFHPLAVLKPVVLEPWDRLKMQMPDRSFEKYALSKNTNFVKPAFIENKKPFKTAVAEAKPFGEPSLGLLHPDFRAKLELKLKQGASERASTVVDYEKNQSQFKVPQFLKHTRMYMPTFKTDLHNRPFGFSTHAAWETFVKEMKEMKAGADSRNQGTKSIHTQVQLKRGAAGRNLGRVSKTLAY